MRDLSADHDLRWLSLNTGTVRAQGDFLAILEAAKRHGISIVSPWRDQIAAVGLDTAVRALRDGGFSLSGYCRGGLFPTDAAHRDAVRDDNRRAIDEAKELGAPCLVIVVGGLPQFNRDGIIPSHDIADARAQVADGVAEMLDYAEDVGMPLALEPLHPMMAAVRSCLCTLRQALDLCDALDPDRTRGLGITLDVYHVWWDTTLAESLQAARGRILGYHLCDWLEETRDMLLDRGMMGDGVADLRALRAAVEEAGYAGACEVEIFSARDWWQRRPDEVLDTVVDRFRSVC